MRGVTKLLLAAALVALLAIGFAACGGDDSDDPTAASTATATERTEPATSGDDNAAEQPEKKPGDDRGGSTDRSEDPKPAEPAGSDDSGSDDSSDGSDSSPKGSKSFRTPGGDNSIQNYGDEADDEEREAASAVVLGFIRARARGDWETVCSYMAAATLKPLEQLGERAPQFKDKECPELLEALSGSAPASTRAVTISGGIDSLRFTDQRAFALYHGTDGKDYVLQLVKEGDEWKVGALAPSELPG